MILAIDTSGSTLGVALWDDGDILAESIIEAPRDHCRMLAPALKFLLDSAGRSMTEVTGVAVVHGPGFFTGLRVGVAAAKAVAFALGVPVVGISALEALAYGAWNPGLFSFSPGRRGEERGGHARQHPRPALGTEGPQVAVLAVGVLKKDMVGAALFSAAEDGLKRIWQDTPVSLEDLGSKVAAALRPMGIVRALLVGEGVRLLRKAGMLAIPGVETMLAPAWADVVRPSVVGKLGAERFAAGMHTDASGLQASYLRPSEAEILWTERNRGE